MVRNAVETVPAPLFVLVAALLISVDGCDQADRESSPDLRTSDGVLVFQLGEEEGFYPWSGVVTVESLEAQPASRWGADFDIELDLRRLRDAADVVDGLVVAIVGEPVHDAEGWPTGLSATTVSSAFTSAGIPLSYYEGTLPVRALGHRRGSPFEATVEIAGDDWSTAGRTRLRGRWEVEIPGDIEPGYYRPHVAIFARITGTDTPVDLGHLPFQLAQWPESEMEMAGPVGRHEVFFGESSGETIEFMHDPQVLPAVVVGSPAQPRVAWTLFHDVEGYGQSGLLAQEDTAHLGLLNRVRYPTPLVLLPGRYSVNPGMPSLFPEAGLAGVFIGEGTVVSEVRHYFDFHRGSADGVLVGPDGTRTDLGRLAFAGSGTTGPVLNNGGFRVSLEQTGEYEFRLTGTLFDRFGRRYEAGGTYRFTIAMPLSFSTPVKPGTNFIAGARFPASAHVNPPLPADVQVEVTYLPQSDPSRAVSRCFEGRANRFGHYYPAGPPLEMDEPGEYRSLVSARFVDAAGTLWQASQASAGVIAEEEPDLILHGGRTFISPPNGDLPHYGGYDRYQLDYEGGSSYLEKETLSQFDHTFPYHSGDTLFVATTYPFESVVGAVLSMEARSRSLAARLVRAYNPEGRELGYPITPRWRTLELLPDVFKFGEDNFGYHRISEQEPDHLPILSANRDGLHPLVFPDGNLLEAYSYMSVVRPGFQVLSLAFAGSFMGPCWIVSPNPYGGQINTSPNGDLPGDIYRIMAGLVVKDRETGRNYYDAYAAAISTLPVGSYSTSVSAPGTRSLLDVNGRSFPYMMGMDTSDVFMVGHPMMLGGTVMPPVAANVTITVTRPDGTQDLLQGRSNRLGGFPPPRAVDVPLPGAYRVSVEVERDGVVGDVVGSGDGEFYHFAIFENEPELLEVDLPPMSVVAPGDEVVIPVCWPNTLEATRITYSVMMPGAVLDEGVTDVAGGCHEFSFSPERAAIQFPYIDTVDYATGEHVYADTIVFTYLFEGRDDDRAVFDATRIILRGDRLFNPRTLTGESPAGSSGYAPATHPHGIPR